MTTIAQACADVLRESDPLAKVRAARAVARGWRRGALAHDFDVAGGDGGKGLQGQLNLGRPGVEGDRRRRLALERQAERAAGWVAAEADDLDLVAEDARVLPGVAA